MLRFKKPKIARTTRKDHCIAFEQHYNGDVHESPAVYNKAYASVLRHVADAIEKTTNAWADPEVLIWFFPEGQVTAEVLLSPPVKSGSRKGKRNLKP